jgi:GNAT superfamily N-acetyltransferase
MEIADLLRLYDTEFRARPRVLSGRRLEQVDGVLLITGLSNFVCHWAFPEDDAASVISRMADRFRDGAGLTWDVYAHDRPAHLGRPLGAHGFVEEHRSTLLMLDLEADAPAMPAGIEVRRVADRAALSDFVRVSAEAFGASADWQFDAFADRLDGDEDLLFNAYLDGEAAGSSRIEMTRGSKFAGLFGGAVSPRFQGRGLYRAMVAARAGEAKTRGVRYLCTGALETSRPILERLGFAPITTITRWRLPAGRET